MPSRSSSRRQTAHSAPLAGVEETPPAVVVAPADVVVPVISRRSLRERDRGRAATGETPVGTAEDPVEDAASAEDAFVAAARAFRALTEEQQATVGDSAAAEGARAAESAAPHVAPRKNRGRRRFLAAGATVGVMGVAGLLAVSMTLPAEAVAVAQGISVQSATSLVAASAGAASEASDDEIQAYIASSDVQNDKIQRSEDYSTLSLGDLAAEQGIAISNSLYTNDPDAAIQWPFVVGVAMSSPYGMRDTGLHEGIDLVPGAGAPVQSIADGTVRIATESGGNYGVTVYIDHIIDGALITSHYSHMQYGSLRVAAGETVEVGDIIGLVGNTGRSYGAHMHFELIVNDSTIDPLPWLQTNAGRYSY